MRGAGRWKWQERNKFSGTLYSLLGQIMLFQYPKSAYEEELHMWHIEARGGTYRVPGIREDLG